MESSFVRSATAAAVATALDVGLKVDDALILHNSNRLSLRLMPCDVVSRVAPITLQANAAFEVEVARRLAETGSPVAALAFADEPHLYVRDGFVISMWTYYEPASPRDVGPREYARALRRLHAGTREIDLPAPHFTERVVEAQRLVDDPARTPALEDADRKVLGNTLRTLSAAILRRDAAEQILHGEPHPGNLLQTKEGPLFIDFETCCRGPVEFDLAHAPGEVSEHYPGIDAQLLRECRILMLAMVASWRWDRNDDYPDGRRMGMELLSELRAAGVREGLDAGW